MSADRWSVCPKCKRNAEDLQEEKLRLAEQSYGKVDRNEYLRLLREADRDEVLDETLRQDWEIRIDEEETFSISFGCSCSVCGFEFSYSHAQDTGYE